MLKNNELRTLYRVISIGFDIPDGIGVAESNSFDYVGAIIVIRDSESGTEKIIMKGDEVFVRDIYEGDLVFLDESKTLQKYKQHSF